MKTVNIYTDGACRGNPGDGGWGVLIEYENITKEYFGGERNTTNNQMELKAAIEALKVLNEPCEVKITTDSKYVMQGITSWLSTWKGNNWKTSQKKPVKNVDLWQRLDSAVQKHRVEWSWVKGHSGHIENERVDMAANLAIDELLGAK